MKKRHIIKIIIIALVSVIFLMSAYTKLSQNAMTEAMFKALNLLAYKRALGIIDIIIVLCLWTKKTRTIGILLATAYLGGAIASEFSLGSSGVIPALCMGLLWIVHKLDSKTLVVQNTKDTI